MSKVLHVSTGLHPIDAIRGPDHAFYLYNAKSEREDQEFLDECNGAMDSLLVFAGLFSAVTTALIVETYEDLKEEPTARTEQLLEALIHRVGNVSSPADVDAISYSAPTPAVCVNALFFLSLCVSLLAALSAILIKQWARNLYTGLHRVMSPRKRARERYRRREGIRAWNFYEIITWIPMLLHVSLFLFLTGLMIWLWSLNQILFILIAALSSTAFISYIAGASIRSFDKNAPFDWPMSTGIQNLALRLQQPRRSDRAAISVAIESKSDTSTPDTISFCSKIIASPVDQLEALTQDLAAQDHDPIDISILADFIRDVYISVEVEAVLHQCRRLIFNLPTPIRVSTNILTTLMGKGADLALTCGTYNQGRVNIQAGLGFERATIVLQFFETILQTSLPIKACELYLNPVTKVAHSFLETALEMEEVSTITLGACCLARLEWTIKDRRGMLAQVQLAPTILDKLDRSGPLSSRKTQSRKKNTSEIEKYQASLCAYISTLVELLIICDENNLAIEVAADTINSIKVDGCILVQGSVHDLTTTNHVLLLEFLRNQWNNLEKQPKGLAYEVLHYYLVHLGQITNDGIIVLKD